MPSGTCPVCGKGIRIDADQVVLYEQITCPACDATLEIIDVDPITLEDIDG